MADVPAPSPAAVADRLTVGVVVARRRLTGPWGGHAWLARTVLPAAPRATSGTPLGGDADEALFYAGPAEIVLQVSATSHYRDNLGAERPSLWVALRPHGDEMVEVAAVTADPYEGESFADAFGDMTEAVPMPPEIGAAVAAFVEAFHVDRPFLKRVRDRADPEALGRRRGGRRGEGIDE